ncbi:T9SS type A sorting domain-containing protein [Seonamhaeicola algicola]|uniref:T9SS type A sorting domain-containing protein n=1 Tax=Seonamhaeicola algicola TaxID=1719036 RepID=A0A5C7ATE9_9FLAO|nr:spondin domain-containing protein [Seonamhaeicola algicola]TXE11990.1 T9SS type A sorting domain-containing protein [Seonamhaeicola algicola]
MNKNTLVFTVFIFFVALSFAQSTAIYNVEFTNFWNANDHNNGNNLPENAHWSDLVITTHNNNVTFFKMNEMASPGVALIAELGDVSNFKNEDYQNAINAGYANNFINAGGLFLSSGNTITYNNLQISENFSLVSILSMIAPSPDWFIGVNGVNLQNTSGWINAITIDLYPYDAGTEAGSTYSLNNPPTNPQSVIQNIQGVQPFNNEKVATITFTLQSVLNTSKNAFTNIKIYPNPANDKLFINNLKNISNLEIYSLLGKLHKKLHIEKGSENLEIDISNLNTGIYLLKLNSINNVSVSKRLIIN